MIRTQRTRARRRGMALLIVLVIVLLVALATYGILYSMRSAYREAKVSAERAQARLAALSGVEWALSCLELSAAQREALGGLENNPALFHTRTLLGDAPVNSPAAEWAFSATSPRKQASVDSRSAFEFGLENESAKLHIPTLLEWNRLQPGSARTALLNLPGASEEVVDSWLATHDGQSRRDGAKQIPNWFGHWYGSDWNQNYQLDPFERLKPSASPSRSAQGDSAGRSGAPAGNTGQAARARSDDGRGADDSWQRYLTWHHGQRNETWEGKPRLFLNSSDLTELQHQLSEIWPADWAAFVIAYRQFGPAKGNLSVAEPLGNWRPDLGVSGKQFIVNPLELIGTAVDVTSSDGKRTRLTSPFSDDASKYRDYLGRLIDEVSTVPDPYVVGRVDILAAPREVLLGIPGCDSGLADRIVAARRANPASGVDRRNVAWLLLDGHVDLLTLQKILPWISCRSDVYRAQFLGFRDPSSPVFRCTVTVDARQRPATVHDFQHWHDWDRGIEMMQVRSSNDQRPRESARILP